MTIQRSARRKNYALIDQRVFDDERLDHKLLGILTYLLSKPDNWTTNSRQLSKRFNTAIDTIKKHLAQLEDIGYLKRVRSKNELGQFTWTTIVYEVPIAEKTIDGKAIAGKTIDGKTSAGKTVDITNNEVTITEFNQNDQDQEPDDDTEKPKLKTEIVEPKIADPFFTGQHRAIAREVVKVAREFNPPKNFITDSPWGRLAEETGKDALGVWQAFESYMIGLHGDKKDPRAYVGKIAMNLHQTPGSEHACKPWLDFSSHFKKNLSAPPAPKKAEPRPVEIVEIPDREASKEAFRRLKR